MSFNAPPPPLPLPGQGLLPVPPPPPSMSMMMQAPPIPIPPPPPLMGLQLQQLQQPPITSTGMPIPLSSSVRPSFQIVLINLPKQLQNNRSLRDWLSSCAGGSIRNVLFVPSPKRSTVGSVPVPVPVVNKTNTSMTNTTTTNNDPLHIIDTLQSSALVTISNADSALKIIACYRYCKKKILESENDTNSTELDTSNTEVTDDIIQTFHKLQVHAVPVHPDIPLPPAILDTSTTQLLGDKLYHAYLLSVRLYNNNTISQSRSSSNNNNQQPSNASTTIITNENIDPKTTKNTNDSDDDDDPQTNYGDDDDDDPLTTPIVLDAVQQFRINLEKLQGSKATRRKELVLTKLNKSIPTVRETIVLKEKLQQIQQQQPPPPLPLPTDLSGNLPPPPILPVPLPAPLPTTGAAAATGAPRGVSNLPAWMTQQQQQESEQTNADLEQQQPTSKRLKTEQVDNDNNNASNNNSTIMVLETSIFPLLTIESICNELRTFISTEIQQYLGVEEITLIDFIYTHIIEQKSVHSLLPELQQVLDDDAIVLLQSLWNKTIQLQQLQQQEQQQ